MGENNANIICDGEFEIVKITEDLYDQAVELYQKYFMKYENVSIATNLLATQQSIDEMEILLRGVLSDGISFAAKHRETNELIAMCCNKIFNPSANVTLDDVYKQLRSPSMQFVGEYLTKMETTFDVYKEWNIDCVLEIFFLSTRSDYGRRGLALKLSSHSVEYARKMLNGTLPAEELQTIAPIIRDQKPKAIISVFSSRFSQKVGEKLNFQILNQISHKDLIYEGKTFAEKLDPIHAYSKFAALKL